LSLHPRRAERVLVPASFVTALGNNVQLIGAALLLVRQERTMLAVGWLFIAVAVPQAVLSPYFGRLADRLDRRTLWCCCDLASALTALALPAWLAAGLPGRTGAIYAATFLLAVLSALFVPASAALIKERVAPSRLRRFNAHYETALQAGMLLSASVGGFAIQFLGATPLFVFNAGTFVASATLVLRAGPRPSRTPRPASAGPAGRPSGRLAPRLIVLYAQGNVVVTVFNALLPVMVIAELHRPAGVMGVIDALGGAGFLGAAVSYRFVARGGRADLRIVLGGLSVSAVLLVAQAQFGVVGLLVFVPLGAFVFGQSRIACRSLLMASVDESAVGRAFGLANAWGLAATVVVMLAVATVTDHSDTRYGFAALASVSAAGTAVAGLALRPRHAPPPAVAPEPTPELTS
jgi:MFS family permease